MAKRNIRSDWRVGPSVTTVGFIGAGHIGSTLAQLAVHAGYDVVMSNSRGPQTLEELVDRLGPHARAATVNDAAAAGDLVVVTIPLRAWRDVPVEPLAGKTVIDTMNYYPQRDGHIAALDDESTTTSELLATHLPTARVVKAFNNINFAHLASLGRPPGSPDRVALPIAGDDAEAKAQVADFIDAIGFDVVDAGGLAEGWRFQRDTPAYVTPYADGGAHGDAQSIRRALADARRYADMAQES